MSNRKGNIVIVTIMLVLYAIIIGSRMYTVNKFVHIESHADPVTPSPAPCVWKQGSVMLHGKNYVCDGKVKGDVWEYGGTWNTPEGSFDNEAQAMRAVEQAAR